MKIRKLSGLISGKVPKRRLTVIQKSWLIPSVSVNEESLVRRRFLTEHETAKERKRCQRWKRNGASLAKPQKPTDRREGDVWQRKLRKGKIMAKGKSEVILNEVSVLFHVCALWR